MTLSRTTVVAVAVVAVLLAGGQSAIGQTLDITPKTPVLAPGGLTYNFSADGTFTPPVNGFNQIKVTLKETLPNGVINYTTKRATHNLQTGKYDVIFNHNKAANATYEMKATMIGHGSQIWVDTLYKPVP